MNVVCCDGAVGGTILQQWRLTIINGIELLYASVTRTTCPTRPVKKRCWWIGPGLMILCQVGTITKWTSFGYYYIGGGTMNPRAKSSLCKVVGVQRDRPLLFFGEVMIDSAKVSWRTLPAA
jgi:hypothetical protein